MDTRILLIENESELGEALCGSLIQAGYQVISTNEQDRALDLARAEAFHLIVADVTAAELDGFSLCRALRARCKQSTPIMILAGRDTEWDRIIEREDGADDYVMKPFSPDEFMARVRLMLRRASTTARSHDRIKSGNLALDLRGRRVSLSGHPLKLSYKEFDLLAFLIRNKGVALSRDLLVQRIWGEDRLSKDRTVDVHVRWLREKIEVDPSDPQRIVTVRGVGYRFEH